MDSVSAKSQAKELQNKVDQILNARPNTPGEIVECFQKYLMLVDKLTAILEKFERKQ